MAPAHAHHLPLGGKHFYAMTIARPQKAQASTFHGAALTEVVIPPQPIISSAIWVLNALNVAYAANRTSVLHARQFRVKNPAPVLQLAAQVLFVAAALTTQILAIATNLVCPALVVG